MADFTETTVIAVAPETLFAYLAEISNLPRYFARITSASKGEGEEVHTTATMPDGTKVSGDAWFRVKDADQRIEWGSEGPSDYHGHLDVRPSGDGSEVEMHLHTTRAAAEDPEVQDGIIETLKNIKKQTEPAAG